MSQVCAELILELGLEVSGATLPSGSVCERELCGGRRGFKTPCPMVCGQEREKSIVALLKKKMFFLLKV